MTWVLIFTKRCSSTVSGVALLSYEILLALKKDYGMVTMKKPSISNVSYLVYSYGTLLYLFLNLKCEF